MIPLVRSYLHIFNILQGRKFKEDKFLIRFFSIQLQTN